MELGQIINTDTVKLTLIPGLIVVLVLFFWFRRSAPKANIRTRETPRQRAGEGDPLFETPAVADFTATSGDAATRQTLDGINDVVVVKRSPTWERKMAAVEPVSGRNTGKFNTAKFDPIKADPIMTSSPVEGLATNKVASKPSSPILKAESIPATIRQEEEHASESIPPLIVSPSKDKDRGGGSNETRTARVDRDLEKGMMLILNIYSVGRPMRGPALLKAVTAAGLAYGKMGAFHYVSPHSGSNRPLFSLANMVEPGSFNLSNLEELSTPGLCLFANITHPDEAMSTFNAMLETARKLADTLHATVCDERRGTLSKQGIEHIYMRIQDFQRRSRLAQAASA